MAQKQRTIAVRVKLTEKAYKYFAEQAFKNVREPWQELAFRLESQVGVSKPASQRYDAPATYDAPTYDVPQAEPGPHEEPAPEVPVDSEWTPEQEALVSEVAKGAKASEAQITALRFMHKTPEAVIAALGEPVTV